jgi:hypothetical protein
METINKTKYSPLKATNWGETIRITNHKDITFFINSFGNSNAGIPSEEDREIAAFIIKACNNYESILDMLKELTYAGQEALEYKDGSGIPILREAVWKSQSLLDDIKRKEQATELQK